MLPPREGNNTSQTNSQAGTLLPPREVSSPSQAIISTPASSQASGIPPNSPPAIAHLPPGEGSNSLLAAALLPSGEGSSSSQAITLLPTQEGSNSTLADSQSQSGTPPLNSPPAIAHLPPSKGSNSSPATAHLPLGEGSSSSQAIALLPSGEGSNASQATALLPSKGSSIPQATSSPQAGQFSNPNRSVRQGHRHSSRHRAPQSSQENSTISWEDKPTTTNPNRPPQGSSDEEPNPKWVINLSNKPLTPAQRSVLAKGPNFVVTPGQPPNLEYITAIEAACTKLSQQDAEELRADINRVLRSSHPPNLI